MGDLSLSMAEACTEGLQIILTGDFNAKSVEWGSPYTDRRGDIVSEVIASMGLTVVNNGNIPTFSNRNGMSYIDVTCCTEELYTKITEWKVTTEENGSPHNTITFEVVERVTTGEDKPWQEKWQWHTFKLDKLQEALSTVPLDYKVETSQEMDEFLGLLCTKTIEKSKGGDGRWPPVYWWATEIAEIRKETNKARRKLLRSRKKRIIEEELDCLYDTYKGLKRHLKIVILRRKRSRWKELIETSNEDVWGEAYTLIVKKVKAVSPEKLDSETSRVVVEALFPTHDK